MSLYSELKDRKVIRVAAVYLVVAWIVVQVVVAVSTPLLLPDWFARAVILLLALGFPFALILSWVFDATPAEGSDNRSGKPLAFGLIAATAIVIGFIVTGFNSGDSEPTAEATISAESTVLPNSVAVLLCDNLSPDEDDAYFAAGIHEEILNQLVKLSALNVIARTSVLQYADNPPPIPQIAEELNVGSVLECSVRFAGTSIMVTAQLIDPLTNSHLWSETYPGDIGDLSGVFAMQADIAMNIANALRAEFSTEEQALIEAVPTESPEAYRYYLIALEAEEFTQSIEYLDLAIEADPEFALAYVIRGWKRVATLNQALVPEADFDSVLTERESLALEDIERALELNPNLAGAYAAKGWIHLMNWRGTEAKEAFERAYELNPNQIAVLNYYSLFSGFSGNLELAVELSERQYELNPAEMGEALGKALWASGEIEQSVTVFNKSLLANPREIDTSRFLAVYEFENGNSAEAKTHLDIVAPEVISIGNIWRVADLAYQYRQMGFTEESENLMDFFDEHASINRVASIARIYENLARGDEVQALYWLEQVVELKEPYQGFNPIVQLVQNAFHYPVFDKPEFVAVREKLGYTDL